MIEEGRSCLDVAQQLLAVEKAVREAKKTLIHDHVDHCLEAVSNGSGKASRSIISEFKEVSKYL